MPSYSKTDGQIYRETAADLRKAAKSGALLVRHPFVAGGFIRSACPEGKAYTELTQSDLRAVLKVAAADAFSKSNDLRFVKHPVHAVWPCVTTAVFGGAA